MIKGCYFVHIQPIVRIYANRDIAPQLNFMTLPERPGEREARGCCIEQFHPPLTILLQAACDAVEKTGANPLHLALRSVAIGSGGVLP